MRRRKVVLSEHLAKAARLLNKAAVFELKPQSRYGFEERLKLLQMNFRGQWGRARIVVTCWFVGIGFAAAHRTSKKDFGKNHFEILGACRTHIGCPPRLHT